MTEALQQILNALSLGALYALLALGLAVVFSVLGLINFAHGELLTIAGFTMLGLSYVGLSTPLLYLGGVLAAGLAALGLERVIFRPVRGASANTLLLISFGASLVLQNVILQLVPGGRPRAVPGADWLTGVIKVGEFNIQVLQLFTTGVTAIAVVFLVIALKRTPLGVWMRASAEDVQVVRLMGVRADKVVRGAFLISGLLAGIAAIFYVARRGAVEPYMGFVPVIKAFVATIIGGMGSLVGAVVGGFLLAGIEVAVQSLAPSDLAGLRDAFVFSVVGILLLLRPQGLFGTTTSESL